MISAIITTHNRSALLRRAIESVLNQTYRDIECIVVDDKSTDNTKDVCSEYPTVQYIYIPPEESKGGNYARNKGIKTARGEYIAFLDDDDYWFPEKIFNQVQILDYYPQIGVVYCGRKLEFVTNEGIKYKNESLNQRYRGDVSKKLFENIFCTTSTLLIRNKLIEKVNFFDEKLRFWQEYDLVVRLSQICEFEFVNKPLVMYRIDKTDGHRLTNKYKEWKNTVSYFRLKHTKLIKKLSFKERVGFEVMTAQDAVMRCNNARHPDLRKCKYKYYILYYFNKMCQKLHLY